MIVWASVNESIKNHKLSFSEEMKTIEVSQRMLTEFDQKRVNRSQMFLV